MGLFGLSTGEAILLAQKLNIEHERRKDETLQAMNKQQKVLEKQAEADRKAQLDAIGQIGTEARQLEPFITLQLVSKYYQPIDETIAIRPSDIREIKRMDYSYSTTDFDSPAPFGYYSKTIHIPYTAVILWNTKQINVVETVEDIQEKVKNNILRLSEIQAQILVNALRK